MNSIPQAKVCVIGAGPYGLAIAAHLRHLGVDFRIFGSPMRRWLAQMPKAMYLKSEGCASNLPDPAGPDGLTQFCHERAIAFSEYGAPLSREVFANYAQHYQQKLVPKVEDVLVSLVRKTDGGFEVRLRTGETLNVAKVVVATGLDHMEVVPEQLRELPSELWSHSAAHSDFSKFKGKEVIVIGAGQSGLETAALLKEEGASATLVVRASTIAWNKVPSLERRPLYKRLRLPRTQLGEGLKLLVYDRAPELFHHLPQRVRISLVKETLGPAGAWWLKERVMGQMPILLSHQLRAAEGRNGRVALHLTDEKGQAKELVADHVIASTGYRYDLQGLPFLDESLKLQINREEHSPRLSSHFECSIPGLYFSGLASTNSFGPVMRFLAGIGFTSRRIATHIARGQRPQGASFFQQTSCAD
jgi:cation diffusion facilitator CzcD-associated flavoprotein CzcO